MDSLPKCESHQALLFVPAEIYVADRTFGASDHSSPCQECPCWNPAFSPSKKKTFSDGRGLDCKRLCTNTHWLEPNPLISSTRSNKVESLTIWRPFIGLLPRGTVPTSLYTLSCSIFATAPKHRYLSHFTGQES